MRALARHDLAPASERYLVGQQGKIDQGSDAQQLWKAQRQTGPMRTIVSELLRITGPRGRCMFCDDSYGGDIEHFRPRAVYPDWTFRWPNLLWACSPCNRQKGSRFPLTKSGSPLLLDPTTDDPWAFFVYDAKTGNLAPRWLDTAEDPRAKATLEVVLPRLNGEAVTEGRRRVHRRIRRAVEVFRSDADLEAIRQTLSDLDAYGLDRWCFVFEGSHDEPFASLHRDDPASWRNLVEHVDPP